MDEDQGSPAPSADTLLSLRDVTITFGGVRAVEALSFDVAPASITSLIGPNGAGKTTVLNCISGFVRAGGSVTLNGVELLRRPAYRRAALGVGRTFQNLQLFHSMTLLENVLIGEHSALGGNMFLDMLRFPVVIREREARARALATLHLLGIERYAQRRADGLPFGVQKLAGVARALAMRPRLLLLDEPAAGLNRREAETLASTVVSLRQELGITILLVEHNMRLVMGISDHIVVLDEGRKLTEGTATAVGQNPAVIAAYLGTEHDPEVEAEVRHELADRS